MGKAEILSHLGGGLYSISMLLDVWRIRKRIEALLRDIARLSTDAEFSEANVAQKEADLLAAQDYLNIGIATGAEDVQSREVAVTDATSKALEASRLHQVIIAKLKIAEMELEAIQEEPQFRQMECWCADYSEYLSGEVGTVEIDWNMDGPDIQIRPGYSGQSQYMSARDGMMQPVSAGTPEAVFYNAAMRPGVEKWRPRYAHATISFVDDDSNTCAISFTDGARKGEFAENVPITYMDCNSVVFLSGDSVLVEFLNRDPSKPVVIGFKENPRPCIQICASIYDFYFNMYEDSTFLAFYNAWTEKYSQWVEHVDRWKAFANQFITTVNLMPESDLKTLYLLTYNEYVYPRYQSILEASVPIQNARAILVFLYTEYIKVFQGQLAYRKIKEGIYVDDGTGSLISFDACTLGGFSRIPNLAYNSIASMPYALRYSLAGSERLQVNLRTYWNPDTLKANLALDAITAQPFPATGYIFFRPPPDYEWTVIEFANPTLGHTVYLDGVAIGTRTPAEFTLQTEYSVDDKSEHVVSIMTDFRLPNIPTGTLPAIDWENQPVPCPPASVPPATPVFDVVGSTDMTVNGGTFKVFVTKFPEE